MAEPTPSKQRTRREAILALIALLVLFATSIRRFLVPSHSENAQEPAVAGNQATRNERTGTAFEPSDWNLGPAAVIYVGTLILLVVSCFVLIAAYPKALPDVARTVRIAPPGPRLLTNPSSELKRVRAREERQLNSYYWVNKSKGIVHIPIEQAMQKLAKSGISGFGEGQQQ